MRFLNRVVIVSTNHNETFSDSCLVLEFHNILRMSPRQQLSGSTVVEIPQNRCVVETRMI